MLISSLQSTSSLLTEMSSLSSTSNNTKSSQNSFQGALSNLMDAIQSGDTASAQKYLQKVEELSSSKSGSSNNSSDPLKQFISSVSSALSSGDISAAQSALTTFEQQISSQGSQTPPPSFDTSSSSGLSEIGRDVLDLFSAISSGDTKEAQSAYDSLTSLLNGDSSSSGTTSATSSSSDTNSFKDLLSKIGSALSSNDISAAQSDLDNFLKTLSSGSLVSTTA